MSSTKETRVKLRFRKYVKEREGYMVALVDPEGNIVTTDCARDIDELDEFNDWRVNEKEEIVVPKALKGYNLMLHSGSIEESEAYGPAYSVAKFNEFLKSLK